MGRVTVGAGVLGRSGLGLLDPSDRLLPVGALSKLSLVLSGVVTSGEAGPPVALGVPSVSAALSVPGAGVPAGRSGNLTPMR